MRRLCYFAPPMSDPSAAAETPPIDSTTITNLKRVIAEHQTSQAVRSVQAAELQLANEYIKLVDYDEALRILRPLWHSMLWRKEGWWDLAEAVARLLQKTAALAGDGGTVVAVDWELMSSSRLSIQALPRCALSNRSQHSLRQMIQGLI